MLNRSDLIVFLKKHYKYYFKEKKSEFDHLIDKIIAYESHITCENGKLTSLKFQKQIDYLRDYIIIKIGVHDNSGVRTIEKITYDLRNDRIIT